MYIVILAVKSIRKQCNSFRLSLKKITKKAVCAFTLWSNTGQDQEVCEHCLRIGTYKLLLDDYIFPTYFVYLRATPYRTVQKIWRMLLSKYFMIWSSRGSSIKSVLLVSFVIFGHTYLDCWVSSRARWVQS